MTCWKVLLLVSHAIVGNPVSSERVRSRQETAVDPLSNPPSLMPGLTDARLVGFLLAKTMASLLPFGCSAKQL